MTRTGSSRIKYLSSKETNQKKRSNSKMSEAAISGLDVVITCSRKQYLTNDESKLIRVELMKQIISDACSPQQGTERPNFNGTPLFEDGAIKLWCNNVYTLAWLKETVRKLSVSSCPILEVKSQSEVQKRTLGRFSIPDAMGVFKGVYDIKRTLCYQNPGIDFDRLEVFNALHNDNSLGGGPEWNMQIWFPEDQKRALEKAGCRLSIGSTMVNVQFDK